MECPFCGLINIENAQKCDCGYDFVNKIKPKRPTNYTFNKIVFTIVACSFSIFLIYAVFFDTPKSYRSLGNYKLLVNRYKNCRILNKAIEQYYSKNSIMPKNINELQKIVDSELLIDPVTKKSNWEVCDMRGKWYKTFNETSEINLPLWKNYKSGIFKIRPRNVKEENLWSPDVIEEIKNEAGYAE